MWGSFVEQIKAQALGKSTHSMFLQPSVASLPAHLMLWPQSSPRWLWRAKERWHFYTPVLIVLQLCLDAFKGGEKVCVS